MREINSAVKNKKKTLHEFLDFIHLSNLDSLTPYEGKIHQALLSTLYESRSWLAMVMITDFLGLTQTFNDPGNLNDSNWRERIPLSIDSWNKKYATILASLDKALKESGRFHKL